MHLHYFDARPHLDTDAVRSAMGSLLAYPSDEILDQLLNRYGQDDALSLLGAIDGDEDLVGLLGMRLDEPGVATILHLFHPENDVEIGGALIRKGIALHGINRLSGRSSQANLPFFAGLGFESWVVGEKPRGSTWFGVRWTREQP